MKKAIVVLSGNPTGKNIFRESAMRKVWVRNANPKDKIAKVVKTSLYGEDDGTENFYKFLASEISLLNKFFNFTEKFVADEIEKFLADDGDKIDGSGKSYDRYILVIHGISPDMARSIEERYGAFTLHICGNGEEVFNEKMVKQEKSQYLSDTALVLNMDAGNFEETCLNFVLTLTN